MLKIKLLLISLFISFIGLSQNSEYIFKFKVNDKSELKTLTKIISIDNYKDGIVTAYANENSFTEFKKLGYSYELLPHPSEGKSIVMATTVAQMANWDRYPTYDVYIQMMNKFATDYPNLCQIVNIGTSEDGRQLIAVKISDNVSTHEAEPEFLYTSSMHGDETTGFVLMLRLIDYLLSNYGTVTQVTTLVNNIEIYINPAANPDGTYYGGNSTVSGSQRYNFNGVDLNRNFPSPNDQNPTYQYENEIVSMINFAENHNFVFSANFHGGAEVMNYPWDSWYSNENPHADDSWLDKICTDYVTSARLLNSGYMTDVTSSGVTEGADWYLVDGSRQDNMTYFQHCKEITIECSTEKTLQSEQLPTYWNINKNSLLNYIEEVLYGFNGKVTNINDDPLDAKIEIISHDKDNSWSVTDPANGDYYRLIAPGTYSVTYSSEGYISQTHTVTVSGWQTTTIKNVVLLQAQIISLNGTITDISTGNPIQGATVEVLNTSHTATTNSSGVYSISNIYEGTYDIKASKSGYAPVITNVAISESNNVVDFQLEVSQAIGFETEIPTGWTFTNTPWTRSNDDAYEGDWSMKSGNISDNGISVMQVSKACNAGTISFFKKVSSEAGWDFLKFYIDGTETGSWSGEVAWSEETFTVSAGTHTFKWEYSKDSGVDGGSDCAWVDYVTLPPTQTFSVTFNVKCNSIGVEGANISLTGYGTQTTNASGVATFTGVQAAASPGIAYSVSATGYELASGNVIVDGNETVNVTLTEVTTEYSITFVVKDNLENLIDGALITLTGFTPQSTVSGQTIFENIPYTPTPGIEFTVTKTGFNNFTDFVIVDNNKTVNVQMTPETVIIENTDAEFNVYPNPSSGKFYINNTSSEVFSYVIVNQIGQIINISENADNNITEIDLSEYPKGMYFIRITTGKQTFFKPLTIY